MVVGRADKGKNSFNRVLSQNSNSAPLVTQPCKLGILFRPGGVEGRERDVKLEVAPETWLDIIVLTIATFGEQNTVVEVRGGLFQSPETTSKHTQMLVSLHSPSAKETQEKLSTMKSRSVSKSK